MNRILTATTLAATLALPVATPTFADGHTAMQDMSNLIRTRDITGGPVYSIGANYDEAVWMDDQDGSMDAIDWNGDGINQIGEIEDIILDTSGQMVGLVAEIGGFLDIGDKHVMVPVGDLRLVAVDDATYSYVTRLTEEQLEELPGIDEGWFD